MQRTRDWRRKQFYKRIFKWPYVKYLSKDHPFYKVSYWPFRRREELGGLEIPNPDYNREKFKQETQKEIEIQLI